MENYSPIGFAQGTFSASVGKKPEESDSKTAIRADFHGDFLSLRTIWIDADICQEDAQGTVTSGISYSVSAAFLDKDDLVTKANVGISQKSDSPLDLSTYPDIYTIKLKLTCGSNNIFAARDDAVKYTSKGEFNGTYRYLKRCSLHFSYYQWQLADGEFTAEDLPNSLPAPFTKPYPKSLWRVERGGLTHELLPDYVSYRGAFKDAARLSKAVIPDSVGSIGEESFWGTALKRVEIPADCICGAHSFPEDCEIVRRGQYVQLADRNGKAVLDSQARRIYVKRSG